MTAVNLNRAVRGPVTAVPVVAGNGVRIVADTVNNRFVAEADETVLWEGTETVANNLEITLSENFNNFERIRIYGEPWENWMTELWVEFFTDSRGTTKQISISPSYLGANGAAIRIAQMMLTLSTNKITVTNTNLFSLQGTTVSTSSLVSTVIRKVVGINRISST